MYKLRYENGEEASLDAVWQFEAEREVRRICRILESELDWDDLHSRGFACARETLTLVRDVPDENGDRPVVLEIEMEAHQPEPECSTGDYHQYAECGVQGHGGGVVVTERCTACGLVKRTDTWAQDPRNGQQGLYEVSYRECAAPWGDVS